MHPSLNPANLSQLPPALQQTALAALKGEGRELVQLTNLCLDHHLISHLFLPAFYAHLGAPGLVTSTDIVRAYAALQGVVNVRNVPTEAQAEMWPQLWKWIQYIIEYDFYVPSLAPDQEDKSEVHITVLRAISTLHEHWQPMTETISSTPGLAKLVAGVWVLLSRKDKWISGFQVSGFWAVMQLLDHNLNYLNSQYNADLIAGSGGLSDFADLLIGFITYLRGSSITQSVRFLGTGLAVILRTNEFHPEFAPLLATRGVIPALVAKLCRFSSLDFVQTGNFGLDTPFCVLLRLMGVPPRPEWIVQALKAGFLQLILIALEYPQLIKPDSLKQAISDILIAFLPYYTVAVQIRAALAGVDLYVDRTEHSSLGELWRHFVDVFTCFMGTLRTHEAPNRISRLGCDNIECVRITERDFFETCSGCGSTHYCCRACQRLDWKRGHRETCGTIRAHSMEHTANRPTPRDRSFFRTLMDELYKTHIQHVLLSQLMVLRRDPHAQILVEFRYVRGSFTIHATTATTAAKSTLASLGPVVKDQLARASASNGRICVHFISLNSNSTDGPVVGRTMLLPLWMGSDTGPALRRGLADLAREIPSGVKTADELERIPDFMLKLEELVRVNCNAGEIH